MDWDEHYPNCLPHNRNFVDIDSVHDLIKKEIRNLSINDKYRYKKKYIFNRSQYLTKRNNKILEEKEYENHKKFILDRSKSLVDENLTFDKLLNKAQQDLKQNRHEKASQNLTLAIDKLILDKSIQKMNKEELTKLGGVFYKRATTNLEYSRMKYDLSKIDFTIQDCVFVIESGVFFNIELELFQKFKTLLQKASYRKIFIEKEIQSGIK